MKIVMLDRVTLGDDIDLSEIGAFGEFIIYEQTLPQERLERVKDADIIITNKVVIDREIMTQAKNLKLICISATGMNNVDLESAKEFGIEVKNVVGYSTESVVQHTYTLLFALLEQIKYYDDFVKSREWSRSGIFTHIGRKFWEVKGKRLGIIGLGSIGVRVAQVALLFGLDVVYYSTSHNPHSDDFEHLELEELLKSSDIVSIHAPLNENTKNLISTRELSLMRDGAILLNLGRGGIIDENALAKAIDEKNLLVGLDVTEKEPIPEESPLLKIKNRDNLIITPHIAWTSIEARQRLIAGVIKNISEFIMGLE